MADQLRIGKKSRVSLSQRQWDRLSSVYDSCCEKQPGLSVRAFHAKLKQEMSELAVLGRSSVELPSQRAFQNHLKANLLKAELLKAALSPPDVEHAHQHIKNPEAVAQNGVVTYGCGHSQPAKFAAIVHQKWCHETYDLCPTCRTAQGVATDKLLHDNALLTAMEQNFGSLSLSWPDDNSTNVCSIDPRLLLTKLGCKSSHSLLECNDFLRFVYGGNIVVRHLAMEMDPPTPLAQKRVEGGRHPDKFEYPDMQLLRNPGDGSIGLVSWKNNGKNRSGRDYVFIGSLGVSNECIKEVGGAESPHIQAMVRSKCVGAAGGYNIPSQKRCFDPLSLSKCTKKTREFARGPQAKSTACAVTYLNHDKETTPTYNSCYNDMLRRNLEEKDLRRLYRSSKSERERAVKEMEFRVRCMLAVDHFELEATEIVWKPFRKIFSTVTQSKHVRQSWNMSLWECFLLEYARTGCVEYRNHTAVTAHVDGNPDDFMGSLTLFPKLPMNMDAPACDVVRLATNGVLCCPLRGVAFEIESGRDTMQLQLGDTMHVADRTRGVKNWSSTRWRKQNY